MATKTIKSSATIAAADYKTITWTGKTKTGESIIITISDAINMENIDFALVEKGEIVPKLIFTGTYEESARDTGDTPWTITRETATTGTGSDIALGYGVFAIGGTDIGLTRGGGNFKVEREYRLIEADGDRGPVKDRITIDKEVCKLEMNALEIISKLPTFYPGVTESA